MPSTSPKSAFWKGFRGGLPFILVVSPFGLMFGVVAADAGLNIVETMTMTMLVVAGAAQFTAISLMQEQAPTVVVLLTALAVNLRMAMYSAALVPHLGQAPGWKRALLSYFMFDQTFAVSAAEFERRPDMTLGGKTAFYMGTVLPIASLWFVFTYLGAVGGQAIPPEFSLDYAIVICFIAITAPAMRSLPHFATALVSVTGALALVWVPYNLGLIIAAILAMATGARVELWQKGRIS